MLRDKLLSFFNNWYSAWGEPFLPVYEVFIIFLFTKTAPTQGLGNVSNWFISESLFESVKNEISKDYDDNCDDTLSIDPLKFGPQFGYGSGRSSLLD